MLKTKKQEKLDSALNALTRVSVLNRIEFLFTISDAERSLSHCITDNSYSYDPKKIKEFDDLRHSIIHSSGNVPDDYDVVSILEYLEVTVRLFYIGFLAYPFDLKLDPYIFTMGEAAFDIRYGQTQKESSD